ncbi:MAG TPA: nucleotidyltransferase [Candidatus Nitrosotalea sp.]|nr:nucleotidyltransferase [Candidatus Nitrosotalea sp.]
MTGDEYVASIIAKYAVPRGASSPAEILGAKVAGPIRKWAGDWLSELSYSGSYAKGTGVHGANDVDLFISLKSDTPGTLATNYENLFELAQQSGWSPTRQNVSIGITLDGTKADLVPGRIQPGQVNYHSLYRRKKDSWTQTNVKLHVSTVQNSGRVDEIRALKVWRSLHGLDWPSFYLEMFVIEVLSGKLKGALAANVLATLEQIENSLTTWRIIDPANTNNCVSDDLDAAEKSRIAGVAAASRKEPQWGKIIW